MPHNQHYHYVQININPSNEKDTFVISTRMQNIIENHLNHVVLVFIGKLSLSTLRRVPYARVSAIFHIKLAVTHDILI